MAHPANNGLRRSQKTDFMQAALARERSFVKSGNLKRHKCHSLIATTNNPHLRTRQPMEIYRPPNVRTDSIDMPKLNVHAKEFTMTNNHDLQLSQSSGNLAHLINFHHEPPVQAMAIPLQQSKSSGNILRPLRHPLIPVLAPHLAIPIIQSTSQSILHHAVPPPRVNFQIQPTEIMHTIYHTPIIHPQSALPNPTPNSSWPHCGALKRSKSMTCGESQQKQKQLIGNKLHTQITINSNEIDLGVFPEEEQENLRSALKDPNQLPSRYLMDLVKIIMERVIEGIRYSEAGAKLCLSIIEKEKTQTFLESLINTCQQWYQERDKILRGIKIGDGTRFTAFMWFLTEIVGQLKRHQMHSDLQPNLVLLSVLARCCQACVTLPINCLPETECLFFVLTSIGKDLENELPGHLEQLMASVRDGFLASAGLPAIRKTLLQLIELNASNWQLAGSSVLYYYPRMK